MRRPDVFDECFELSASPQCILGRDGRLRAVNRAGRAALAIENGAPMPLMSRYAEDPDGLATLLSQEWPMTGVPPLRFRLPGGRRVVARLRVLHSAPELLHVEILPMETVVRAEEPPQPAPPAPGRVDDDDRDERSEDHAELDRITAMIAHDLRTPIGQITAAMQLYRCDRGRDERETEGGLFWLDVAEAAVARMSELVEGLLARARAGNQGLVREETDLAALFGEAAAAQQRELADAGAVIDCGSLSCVYADRLLFRQVFANLISNALKYRAPGRRLRIAVEQRPVADGIEVTVRDNGMGFEASEAEKLFDPFQRGAGSDGIEGFGYGLATCRIIAERHGWSIRASGERGVGASMTISIPRRDCTALAAAG